jgi:hypothetical protein
MALLASVDQGKNRLSSWGLWLLFRSVEFESLKSAGVPKTCFKHAGTQPPKKRRVGRKLFLKEHGACFPVCFFLTALGESRASINSRSGVLGIVLDPCRSMMTSKRDGTIRAAGF